MVQNWIRQALRASGAAILVPAAIAAAIALSVVGGGGNARSLGQVLTGPAVPPAEHAHGDERPRVRLRGLSPQSHQRLRGLSPQSTPGLRGQSPQSGQHPPVTAVSPRPVPAPPPATSQPAPASQPPAAGPAARPIHDVGTQVADAVRPVPVAGPVAADAVQAVVDLVDPPA